MVQVVPVVGLAQIGRFLDPGAPETVRLMFVVRGLLDPCRDDLATAWSTPGGSSSAAWGILRCLWDQHSANFFSDFHSHCFLSLIGLKKENILKSIPVDSCLTT